MNKDQLISSLESLRDGLRKLTKDVGNSAGTNITSNAIQRRATGLSRAWYEELAGLVVRFGVSDETIARYSGYFEVLLKLSLNVNRKTSYLRTLGMILCKFQDDLLLPVHKAAGEITSISHLGKILANVSDKERQYLEEALGCAQQGFIKASTVLGWCAAVDRMQRIIEKLGFGEFNQKSAEMCRQTTGRFKRFRKEFQVSSLSEFRATVFDADMLWVLEYWGLIDSNQHDRLSACHLMRGNAAHPGEAPISEENLASFYSDLRLIVFENVKFRL